MPSVGKDTVKHAAHSPPQKRFLQSWLQRNLHATRRTPHGASCLVQQAMPSWWVKTRRRLPRHCRAARVYGHMTTAMHDNEYPLPPQPTNSEFQGELYIIGYQGNIYDLPCGSLCSGSGTAPACLPQSDNIPTYESVGCFIDDEERAMALALDVPTCETMSAEVRFRPTGYSIW